MRAVGRLASLAAITTCGAVALVAADGTSAAASSRCSGLVFRALVIVSLKTGHARCDFPSPGLNSGNNTVSAVISDTEGGWFVSCCGASGVERLRPSGVPDSNWRAPPLPPRNRITDVFALALVGDTLYAGGLFGVEALNASTGARLWLTTTGGGGTAAGQSPAVAAITADARAVYVAGGFSTIGGVR